MQRIDVEVKLRIRTHLRTRKCLYLVGERVMSAISSLMVHLKHLQIPQKDQRATTKRIKENTKAKSADSHIHVEEVSPFFKDLKLAGSTQI